MWLKKTKLLLSVWWRRIKIVIGKAEQCLLWIQCIKPHLITTCHDYMYLLKAGVSDKKTEILGGDEKISLPKATTLRQATSHLRIEALRRYRLKHSFDIDDYDDRGASVKGKCNELPETLKDSPGKKEDGIKETADKSLTPEIPLRTDRSLPDHHSPGPEFPIPSVYNSDDDLVTWGETSSSLSLGSVEDTLFQLDHGNVVQLNGEELGFDSSEFSHFDSHYVSPLTHPATLYYHGSPTNSHANHEPVSPSSLEIWQTPGSTTFDPSPTAQRGTVSSLNLCTLIRDKACRTWHEVFHVYNMHVKFSSLSRSMTELTCCKICISQSFTFRMALQCILPLHLPCLFWFLWLYHC